MSNIKRTFIQLISLDARLASVPMKREGEQKIQILRIKKNDFRAFTLIEVMVVMAIISIMAGIIISSLGNGRTVRELETNAREFASVVREAQNYALTGRQFVANTDPCAFRVSRSGSDYLLTYTYKSLTDTNPCSGAALTDFTVVTYTLKNGVTFSSADTVEFSVPHAALNFSVGEESRSAVFNKSSTDHRVCIYADGRITDYAGSAGCP